MSQRLFLLVFWLEASSYKSWGFFWFETEFEDLDGLLEAKTQS
jgi:hypothetical protein